MEKDFLNLIQKEFPIEERPFEILAKKLNSDEDKLIEIYKKLKDEKIIRQTSAIFDTKSLGYKSSLVAFMVDDIENAANFINTHPGVSHNYERDNEFNLWFTIAVEPDSKLGLEKTVELMAKKVNAKDFIVLPTIKMFKIKVQLDVKGDRAKKEKLEKKKKIELKLEPLHFELIKRLQEDIEPVKKPFEKIVRDLNIDYETLKKEAQNLQNAGILRRFASILYHRRAGFNANAMVVWSVDEKNALEIGEKVASFTAVSHCYLRPTYPKWPYPLFSMIHGKTKEEVENVVKDIKKEINPKDYKYLYSTREFKKQRIKYFSDEFKEWEKKYA
ncbi:Lrp/AsnC family transcriptional regulator [Nitrosophilus kaiyonis]|uniref:siroheme decarboxylase subunit alpha n=1 Tax=Nitrosophilus kaiyonis TaxID=2930200 RepID=UPI002490DFC5|nr:Lrp/AsnC family transcriptional regulator [Nitrosophilus kaiyonis]